jgi:YD repeat-containing protein
LSYGPNNHITEIDDSRGRTVRYGYDGGNRLTTVTYPSGEVFHYEYDGTQHLLTFSVAPDAKSAPRLMLRNEYTNGRITKQILGNGDSYTYNYTLAEDGSISAVGVQTPDGRVFNIDVSEGSSTVRVQAPQSLSQEGRRASK